MGSGRRKIEIKRVENEGQRMVTFSKRRRGLFNKARQLRCLTGADIAILTFSPAGRPYTHGEPSFDALVDRYLNTAAAGEKAEDGCEAAAANHHRLNSWLDALQFDASDSIEDLEILKKGTFSPAGRPYTHGEPSFDALVDRYLNTAAAGEKAEDGCEAAAANHHRLNSWLDALQFDASDSIEDLEILKKGLEEIAAKVAEKIDNVFVDSLLV